MNVLSCLVKHRWPLVTLVLFVILKISPVIARQPGSESARQYMDLTEILRSTESCEECHERTTPRIYAEHMKGAHGREGVGCVDCHGDDHRNMILVTAKKGCEQCHPQETAEYLASDHSKSWENMQASARYMKQPEVVRRQGCEACHRIGYGEDDGRCDFCHTKHSFSKAEAARPESCYTCHMGPDHPQMEAFIKSDHQGTEATCSGCHLPGTHNANQNLDRLSSSYMDTLCNECHSRSFNKQWLDGAAMLEQQGKIILQEGRRIIERLHEKGLLFPDPANREANPVEGNVLILGGHQLYEDTSRAEKLYFEMHKYLQIHLAQGAFHQDFKMAAYQGLIPLQNYLAELQAEALLLEELSSGKKSLTPINTFIPERPEEDLYQKTYESSFHGVLAKDRKKPDCKTCHQSDEYGPLGSEELTEICGGCHTSTQVVTFITDLNDIKKHAEELIHAGHSTIEKLMERGVIKENNNDQVELATVFEPESSLAVARIIVKRLNYFLGDLDRSLKSMIVGAAHSNPDYAHWYGNAPAKSDLIEIRDAAHKLTMIQEIYGVRSMRISWYIAGGVFIVAVISGIAFYSRRKK